MKFGKLSSTKLSAERLFDEQIYTKVAIELSEGNRRGGVMG
jgi:hypothetical protein